MILVDELSQNQAAYTAMAFRSASGAVVIGGATAGADGHTSQIPLPGGLRTIIGGVPDLDVKPAIPAFAPAATNCWKPRWRAIQ